MTKTSRDNKEVPDKMIVLYTIIHQVKKYTYQIR